MRHGYFGKKLSRTTDERKRLIRNIARELIAHGTVRTSLAKAKAVRRTVEKLVTKAKRGNNADRMRLQSELSDRATEKVLLSEAKSRFATRTSGFTRIIKLGPRRGDAAEEVLLSFVDERVEKKEVVVAPAKAPVKKSTSKSVARTAKKK